MGDSLQLVQVPDGRRIMKDAKGTVLGATKQITIEDRITDMEKMGIDMQVLSIANPSVYFADPKTNLYLAQVTNDYIAEICKKYPKRFLGFASVPLNDVDSSIIEIKRAINELEMNGLALGTNINGKPLDAPEYLSFFDEANRMGLPILLHPMPPRFIEIVRKYALVPVLGFVLETTITVARIIFSGMLEKYQKMHLILSHLGGALPYLAGRLDWGYRDFADCSLNISSLPSEYMRRIYYDTALSFYKPTMRCAYETAGSDRLVLGSDYPHSAGAPISIIEDIGWSQEDKEKIYSGNILRIIKNFNP